MNKLQLLVNAFLSGDFSNFTGCSAYSVNDANQILFNDTEVICYKVKNQIYIVNNIASLSAMSLLLDCFEGIKTKIVDNSIFINGIEWDGSKCNLNLFL